MDNSSISEYFPTNLTWIKIENCICPLPKNFCYRPLMYTKPIQCVHENILDLFTCFLKCCGKLLKKKGARGSYRISKDSGIVADAKPKIRVRRPPTPPKALKVVCRPNKTEVAEIEVRN
uniref:Uncharacterized protein n=1 Tax=Meloidogyne hapla TaxID=6305 RepID=A0A1I8BJM3_MELHA